MLKRIAILLLLFAPIAEAQIKQITGGGYQNSNGVACAGCILYLQLPVDATVTGTGQIVPNVNSYQLDANGNVPANSNLWANDQLTPSGLTYKATLTNAGGGRIWGPEFLSITGVSPISLTQLVPVASSSVFLGNPAVLNIANTFTAPVTINSTLTVSGAGTFTGTTIACNLNGVICPTALTGAAIQTAINALPSGGTLYLPIGTYSLSATTNEQIKVTQSINMIGAGWGTVLQVTANAPTIPAIHIVPSGQVSGIRMQDFTINTTAAAGGNTSYAIQVDTSPGNNLVNLIIEHISVGNPFANFGGFATGGVWLNNTANEVNGGFIGANILHSYITGGLKCTLCGDSVLIRGDTFRNISSQSILDIDASFVQGSANFFIDSDYFPVFAGIHIGAGATFPRISGNELQPLATSSCTGSNGASVDLDGTVGNPINDADIYDNTWQINSACITLNALRINFANRTRVHGDNRFGIGGAPDKGVVITANATNTRIGMDNDFYPPDGLISTSLSDSGTGTRYAFGGANDSNTPLMYRDSSGSATVWGFGNTILATGNNGNVQIGDGVSSNAAIGAQEPASAAAVTTPSGLITGFVAARGLASTFTGSTGACSTQSTISGGSWAGRLTCTAATAATTLVIVPGGALIATNGWVCSAYDETTRANLLQQTATTTTNCTLTATSVTQNDVIVWSAIAF